MYQLAAPILFRNVYVRCDGSPSSYDSVWEKERVYPTYFCIYVKAIIMIRPSRSFPGLNYTHFPPAFMERLFHLFKMAENLQDFS